MELKSSNLASVIYHNIFNYPLKDQELKKWELVFNNKLLKNKIKIEKRNNFYFLKGRGSIISTRHNNEKYSLQKLEIAKKAVNLISKIPTIKFVGITGSLAMMNSGKNSDIDLMIITNKNKLWTSRVCCYVLLWFNGLQTRSPKSEFEKDKLCLNMWLDESDLIWNKNDRNIYTAHEVAQIVPLYNKKNTFEKFLFLNKWVLDYWPNSVVIKNQKELKINEKGVLIINFIEKVLFAFQYLYMKSKITREVITPTRALFHPNDWGKNVNNKLTVFIP